MEAEAIASRHEHESGPGESRAAAPSLRAAEARAIQFEEGRIGVEGDLDEQGAAAQADAVREEVGLSRSQMEDRDDHAEYSRIAEGVRDFEPSGDVWADMRALNALDLWPAPPERIQAGKFLPILYLRNKRDFLARQVSEWADPAHDAMLREKWGDKVLPLERFWKEVAPGYLALVDQTIGRYPEQAEAEDAFADEAERAPWVEQARAVEDAIRKAGLPDNLQRALLDEAFNYPIHEGEAISAVLLVPGRDFDPERYSGMEGSPFAGDGPVAVVSVGDRGPLFYAVYSSGGGPAGRPATRPFERRDGEAAREAIRAKSLAL